MPTAGRAGIFLGAGLFLCPLVLHADYILILKNGRRLTVQGYREEGGMIKFQGLGGEIGIARDQIQSILPAAGKQERGMLLPRSESAPGQSERGPSPETESTGKEEEARARASQQPDQRAQEEKEYLKKLGQITAELRFARERYSLATGGTGGKDPTLLLDDAAIKARSDDLNSRLRDAQHNPSPPPDAGVLKLAVPSPFTGVPPSIVELPPAGAIPRVESPPPDYTQKERELSDLRNQIHRLENERERLIQEMRQKNFDTGSLFLE